MASITKGLIEQVKIGTDDEQSIASTAYGVCSTAAATAIKNVEMTGFTLLPGVTVHIKFSNANSADNPKLKFNGEADANAKAIMQYGTTAAGKTSETNGWYAGAVVSFTYDGTNWIRDQGFNTNSQLNYGNITTAGKIGSGNNLVITESGTVKAGATIASAISSQTQSTKFLREDGTWAAPSYTTNTDNDTKVTQTGVTANQELSILLKNSENTTDETTTVKYGKTTDKLITVNPSTGRITAPGGLAGKADSAENADNATTATNLASAPILAVGTTDTNKIIVTAGGQTSTEFTVPYASNAGQINVTNTTPTTDTTYYITSVSSTTNGQQNILNNTLVKYFVKANGASANFVIGDASHAGGITIYDGTNNYGFIKTASLGANRTYTLPNANGTIALTSSTITGNAANVTGTVAVDHGGTNITSYTIGDMLYASATTTLSKLGANTTTTRKFLRSVATTADTPEAPEWDTLTADDIPTITKSKISDFAHTHNYAGSSSAGGSATTANATVPTQLTNEDLNTIKPDNTTWYYAAGSNSVTNGPETAGTAFGMVAYRNASGYRAQELYSQNGKKWIRYWNGSTWSTWEQMYGTLHKPSAADIGAATSGHNHDATYLTAVGYDSTNKKIYYTKNGSNTDVVTFGSNAFNSTSYLPLSGGNMSGTINRYYSASGSSLITIRSNNIKTDLFQIGHATSTTGAYSHYYALRYRGDLNSPNNRLELIYNKDSTDTVAIKINESGTVEFPQINKGSATKPIYFNNGVITEGTAIGASAYHADSYFALADHGTHVTTATVKSALGTDDTHGNTFLRKDGTWQTPPYPVTSVATLTGAITASDLTSQLGLTSAMHFIGISTTAITNTGVESPTIDGDVVTTHQAGDVVIYDKQEYVWTSQSKWALLGDESSYALSGHTHGNITNDGKMSGSTVSGNVTTSHKFLREDGSWVVPKYTAAYSLPVAKYNTLGGVKPAYSTTGSASLTTAAVAGSNSPTIAAKTTTTGRYYGVEVDSTGILFVNVPWTDHYDWDNITNKPNRAGSGTDGGGATKVTVVGAVPSSTGISGYLLYGGGTSGDYEPKAQSTLYIYNTITSETITAAWLNVGTSKIKGGLSLHPSGNNSYTADIQAGTLTQTRTYTLPDESGTFALTTDEMAPASHKHGNIQNGGTLQTNDITIANGDKIIVTDSSDSSKIARTSISFDGSTTTKALSQKGTWETFNNYSHPTGDGNSHVPATSTNKEGLYLRAGAMENSAAWSAPTVWHGTCSTAAATVIKDVVCPSFPKGTDLEAGTVIFVYFSNTNSGAVGSIKLRVNSTADGDAKPIKYLYNGDNPANIPDKAWLKGGQTYYFSYDGTNWVVRMMYNTNTTPYGIRVYRDTVSESAFNDDYPLLISRSLASAIASTYSNNVYGVINNTDATKIPTYNLYTGELKAPSFTGNLTGNVTGNITGDVTGNLDGTALNATNDSDGNAINDTYFKLTETRAATTSNTFAITKDTDASSTATGTLTVSGGVGIAKKLYVGTGVFVGNLTVGGTVNTDAGKTIASSSTLYLKTTSSSSVIFHTNSTERARFDTSGHFRPGADATYNIGDSKDYRWKNIYLTTSVCVGAKNTITAYNSNALGSFIGPGVISSCVTAAGNGYYLMGAAGQYARLYIQTIGTASAGGETYLELGNATATGTAKNSRGRARIYHTNTAYTDYLANGITTNGTIADFTIVGATSNTANTAAWTNLILGNNAPVDTANNAHSQGNLRLYSSGSTYTDIQSQAGSSHIFYLPNYDDDMYAVHVGSTSAEGSPTQPVYIAANGLATALTYTQNRLYYSASTTSFDAATCYCDGTNITINGTSIPANSSNFQVVGTSTMQTILPDTTITYDLGSSTLLWNALYIQTVAAHYVEAGPSDTWSDKTLYLGYGNLNQTAAIKMYYSGAASTHTEFFEVNSNGAYALTRFGVNGQNTSYNFYVNGSSYFNGAMQFSGDLTFDATGTTGTSKKIVWSGSTDGAEIYYYVPTSDQGNLVLNTKDDANCMVALAASGSLKMYLNPTNSTFYPATTNSGSLGLGGTSAKRWGAVYIGTADSYGAYGYPVYWNAGVPTQTFPVQYTTWSIASGGTSTGAITKTGKYFADTYVIALVVTSGEANLNGPLTWTTAKDTLTITTSTATSGAVSGYVLTARADSI